MLDDPPVYLVGGTGLPNYGDELIAALWLGYLAEAYPKTPVWLDCPNPGIAAALFADIHPLLRCTDTLWRSAWAIGEQPITASERMADRYVGSLGTPRSDVGLAILSRMRSIHLIGGGYLNSMWAVNCLLPVLAASASRHHGCPAFATGLGVAPQSRRTAELLGASFAQFDFAETRDADLSLVGGLVAGIDDAFLAFHPKLRHLWSNRRAEPPPQYMPLLQGDMHPDVENRPAVLEIALEELRRVGWTDQPLGLVEAIPPDDFWMRDRLDAMSVQTVCYPFQSIWQHGMPMTPGQYWVTTRFHCHLLAAGFGIAGTAIAISDDYYVPKHRSLVQLGTGWRVVNGSGKTLEAGDALTTAVFRELAERLAADKWRVARRLYPSRGWIRSFTRRSA